MIAALDVDYREAFAAVGCVVFSDWQATQASAEQTLILEEAPVEYVSGAFFKRELPCLTAMLDRLEAPPDIVVIDGYVWLGDNRPGLGHHLFLYFDQRIPIVGVAKSAFAENNLAVEVFRGASKQPLYVTASGMEVGRAACYVRDMCGANRIPTLLKQVDQLCRIASKEALAKAEMANRVK